MNFLKDGWSVEYKTEKGYYLMAKGWSGSLVELLGYVDAWRIFDKRSHGMKETYRICKGDVKVIVP